MTTLRRPRLSRRSFLRYAAFSAGLTTVVRLRLPAAAAPAGAAPAEAAPQNAAGLHVLSAPPAEILTAVAERMVDSGEPGMPSVRDTGAIGVIDQALLPLDAAVRAQVGWLLSLVEWSPLLELKAARFTELAAEDQDAVLRGWEHSRFAVRRLGFVALKSLAMLGYYSQDATWKAIHYDGPWAPKPRRALLAPDGGGAGA